MTAGFGIAALIALLAVTGVNAQVQAQLQQQTTSVAPALGQVVGEGNLWGIQEYQGSPVQWGSWGLWGICTGTCGLGAQRRQRICYGERVINAGGQQLQVPSNAAGATLPASRQGQAGVPYNGPGCYGYLIEARGCQLLPCPTGPSYGNWVEWGPCSVSCGGGVRSRTRACLGNTQCPGASLVETEQCNTQPCQVLPVWGPWTDWGLCSSPCGGGIQTRSRSCVSGSCPSVGSTDTRRCNSQACAAVWGLWGNWGQCSVPCGGGTQSRTRPCASGNCPATGNSESRPCNIIPCAPQYGLWSEWTACTLTCGGGTQSRTRPCLGGNCPPGGVSESRQCNVDPCPTIGFWSEWSSYSSCTVTCGAGSRTRTRVCIGSRLCPPGSDTEITPCVLATCVGTWGPWSSYSLCNRECGGGTRARTRVCPQPGTCPGSGVETENCNSQPCTVYIWAQWQPFGSCSATCGQGTYTRSRVCLENGSPSSNIAACTAQGSAGATETQFCYAQACVVISWALWGEWQQCSKPCGGGKQMKVRACLSNGQAVDNSVCNSIVGNYMMERDCNVGPCYSVGGWRAWSSCSATCGPGSQMRMRPCLADGVPVDLQPGQLCGGVTDSLFETRNCIVKSCCSWGEWSPPSCSVTCGVGTATRRRVCRDGNGNSVVNSCCGGSSVFTEACQLQPCLSYGLWSEWQQCSRPCGGGKQRRMRPCQGNGQVMDNSMCESLLGSYMEERNCNLGPCYSLGAWQVWTKCSATCGVGSQTRVRPCLANGAPVLLSPGQRCGVITDALVETRSCIERQCSQLSIWSQWSSCSASCGGGISRRQRICRSNNVPVSPDICGLTIDDVIEERVCQTIGCYSWSLWSSYTACSATCGEGQYRRTRGCVAPDGSVAPDPKACPDPSGIGSLQIRACRVGPCYSWQSWSQSSCSVTCGTGVARKTRRCTTRDGKTSPGGVSLCPDPASQGSTISQACDLGPCYSWTAWSDYTPCSSRCGAGQQFRSRRCATFGGANAPDITLCEDVLKVGSTQFRPCAGSGERCFEVGQWETWTRCTSSCGQGIITRSRSCLSLDGVKAPNSACVGYREEDFILRGTCERPPCPGVYGAWSSWGPCSQSCNSGIKTRTRICQGGGCVGVNRNVEPCNEIPCGRPQVIGTWSVWGNWGSCTNPCGGTRSKTRTCIGGQKPSDCGGEDYVRTIVCKDCPGGGQFPGSGQSFGGQSSSEGGQSSGDSCDIPDEERNQCQPDDFDPVACIAIGCCYDPSSEAPKCYHTG